MTRLRRIATLDRYFFITTNLARNVSPLTERERDVIVQVLGHYRDAGVFWLYGYCVMADHLHLLMRPNTCDVTAAIREIKSVSAARIIHSRGKTGPLWQPKYFVNIIRCVRDFWAKLEYIHNNPVTAELVSTPGQWRWSSYSALTNRGPFPIAVELPDLPQDLDARLW
jgi:REP element-mobilizing transposase RayT